MRRRDIVNELDGKDYTCILHPEKSSTKEKLETYYRAPQSL